MTAPTPVQAPPRGRGSSLLGALAWFCASYGLAIVGYLATNAVVSRWLGVEQYGYFVIAVTVSTGIGQFGLLGAHRAGLRDAAVLGPRDQDLLCQLRASAAAALLVTVPITTVVSAVVLYVQVDLDDHRERVLLALVFGGLVYFSGLQKLWANYLRGLGEIRVASLLEGRSGGALVALAQSAFLVAAWALIPDSTLTGALFAATLGFAVPILYVGARVRRRWRHLRRTTNLFVSLRDSVRASWRFAVNQLATYIGGAVEIWIAGLVLIAADASLFSAAQRTALLLAIPLSSVQVVFAPVCARLLEAGETERLERIVRTGAFLAAACAMVLWVPTLVAPQEVLSLVFGAPFSAAALALFVLSLGSAANVFAGLSGIVLTMSRNEGVAAAVQAVTVVLRIGLGVLCAWQWGIVGLAVSSAALSTLMYVVMWWQARSLLGVRTHVTFRPDFSVIRSTRG